MKANTKETGAHVKERYLFSGAGHLEDGGLSSQSPAPPLHGGRGFIRRERGQNKEIRGGVCKVPYLPMSTVLSNKAGEGSRCIILV